MRLLDITTGYCPEFEVKLGLDNNWYAVFCAAVDADIATDYFGDCRIASYGQYANAIQLTNMKPAIKRNNYRRA